MWFWVGGVQRMERRGREEPAEQDAAKVRRMESACVCVNAREAVISTSGQQF